MDGSIVPDENKRLRACLLCSLIKTFKQFKDQGCNNCDDLLALRGSTDHIMDCTTTTFYGTVALMEPSESWVARWQRLDRFQPGIYAIQVSGRLPEDIVADLDARGISYQPRDGSSIV